MAARLAAIDLGMTQGAAVLGIMERAKVSPLPALYRLLYDYVAGVDGLASNRVRDILADGEAHGADAETQLYSEFVEPYQRPEIFERAISRISARLTTLDLLIVDRAEASSKHSASLRAATLQLAAAKPDLNLVRDWVERLQAAKKHYDPQNVFGGTLGVRPS